MSSALTEMFKHNLWANLRVLETCAGLSDEQLDTNIPGTYGTIRSTLQHLSGAEKGYVARFLGQPRPPRAEFSGFEDLRSSLEETGEALIKIAEEDSLPDVFSWRRPDGAKAEAASSVLLVQVINHGTEHRAHINTTLAQLGVDVCDIDGWAYGFSTDLIKEEALGKFVSIPSESGEIRAYLATPESGSGKGVLLCHAWWGLNDFFVGLANHLALEGYTVLAPDVFDGKVATTIPEAEGLVSTTEADGGEATIAKEQAALNYLLESQALSGSKVGAIGFSMGAAYVTWLATLRPEIGAVVVFYGASEWNADYPDNASAPLQGHWAADDQFESIEAVPELEARIKAAGHVVDFHTYPNTKHWFFELDRPEYDPEAASLAWKRTLDFLRENL